MTSRSDKKIEKNIFYMREKYFGLELVRQLIAAHQIQISFRRSKEMWKIWYCGVLKIALELMTVFVTFV